MIIGIETCRRIKVLYSSGVLAEFCFGMSTVEVNKGNFGVVLYCDVKVFSRAKAAFFIILESQSLQVARSVLPTSLGFLGSSCQGVAICVCN